MRPIDSRLARVLCAVALSVGAGLALVGTADAVSTRSFLLDDEKALAAGELRGTAVHSNGRVTLGLSAARLELPDVPVAYSLAQTADGTVYVGTGSDGKVFRVRGDAVSLFAETGQLVVSSLALGPDGSLFAGTLPEGRIYRIAADGTVAELARPDGVEHIWALAWDAPRRRLFAGTGPEGKIFTVDPSGRAEVYFDSSAGHVMSLAVDGEGVVYAGTSDEAHVLRVSAPGRAEVVYDFPGNEITAIAMRDGRLAVAANEFPAPPSSTKAPATSTSATGTSTSTSAASGRPRPGKGQVWSVGADGRAEELYRNNEGHFTAVQIADDGSIFAASGKDGRIYRVWPDRTHATYIDVEERQVLAMDLLGRNPVFVTGDAGAVYRVTSGRPQQAEWESEVLDAEFASRWGQLSWRGEGSLEFATRSGNTEEPDETWSEWSAGMTRPGPVRSTAARFLQIRARFGANGDPVLHAVQVYFLPQNQRPVVSEVLGGPRSKSGGKVLTKGPADRSTKVALSWTVANADGDTVRYRLRYRAEGQTTWRDILHEDTTHTATSYDWDTSALPDGWYVVEVEASDEPSNPDGLVLRSSGRSEPILVDNHPPRIEGLAARGGRLEGRAVDGLGPIAQLEMAVDGGEFLPIFPDDDLLDTADERFRVDLARLPAGEHILAVRATDAAGNSTVAETTATIR